MDVPSFSGSFGILPQHVPALAVLKPGVVTVFEEDGGQKKFFVSSGSITVNEDSSVQILAEEAHPLESLDAGEAKKALQVRRHSKKGFLFFRKSNVQSSTQRHSKRIYVRFSFLNTYTRRKNAFFLGTLLNFAALFGQRKIMP